MAWTFEITTGKFYNPDGDYISTGYAGGDLGKDPEGKDNPKDENIPDVGPLPEGLYTFGTVVLHSQLGLFAIPLIPDPSNVMYGRSGFYLHGDTNPPGNASEGCIVQPLNTRVEAYYSDDKELRVVAIKTVTTGGN